jgi:serine/threonine protein phosphatase PrpC
MGEGAIRLNAGPSEAAASDLLRWISASSTHVGKIRKLNEDALLEAPQIGLWAVADGVGGANAGDLASSLTVQALSRVTKPETMSGFLAEIYDRLGAVNGDLRRQAEARSFSAIATTIVTLLFVEQHFACAWAGDSRLYLKRGDQFRQVNHDHSEVQELVDQGVIGPAEARHHPRGNVVTRAVGAFDRLDLEMTHDWLREGDIFLLCSDGLSKTAEDDEIAALLEPPIDEAVAALIELALARGGPDNVTIVAVQLLRAADQAS